MSGEKHFVGLKLIVNNLPNKPFEFKEPWISSSKNYWARSLVAVTLLYIVALVPF
jgi:hypothetical protein